MFHDKINISAILLVKYIIFLFILYFLDGILSLVISKISFIPKHFGDKFYQIYSSASLVEPCYFTSTWAIPQADPSTTWLRMRRLVSSPKWRTLTSHSPAGALSGRQVNPYTEGWKLTCSGRNSMLSVSQGSKSNDFLININIYSNCLSALSQYDLLRLCFGLHTETPYICLVCNLFWSSYLVFFAHLCGLAIKLPC